MRHQCRYAIVAVLASLAACGCGGRPQTETAQASPPPQAAEEDRAIVAGPMTAGPVPEPGSPQSDAVVLEKGASDPAATDDAPAQQGLVGRWKITLALEQAILQPWLMEIAGGKGSYTAKVIDTVRGAKQVQLDEFKATDDQVNFKLVVDDQASPFEGALVGQRVRGSLQMADRLTIAWLERTNQKSMGDAQPGTRAPGVGEFEAARQLDDPKQRTARLLQLVEKYPESAMTFDALRTVLQSARDAELSEQQLRQIIMSYEELSRPWGRRWTDQAIETVARELSAADIHPDIALEYAQKAKAALPEDAGEARRQPVHLALAIALLRTGKADDGRKLLDEMLAKNPDAGELRYYRALASEKLGDLDAALETLSQLWPHPIVSRDLERLWTQKHGNLDGFEQHLDQVYRKKYPPIAVEPWSGRQDAASDRVVLAELFTGTSCPPCVAVEVAFDGLAGAFKRSELVLLQYHLHIGGADPLTSPDSEARAEYYKVPDAPFLLIDGEEAAREGGRRQLATEKFAEYRKGIEKQLEQKSAAKIELRAARDGDTVTIKARLHDVAEPAESLRLRFALVEDEVRYTGSNGLRLHHVVVRALPGGAAGTPVLEVETSRELTVDLTKLKETLAQALADFEKASFFEFPAKPLELKSLAVVAFVQDDKTQAISQAAYLPLASPDTEKGDEPASSK